MVVFVHPGQAICPDPYPRQRLESTQPEVAPKLSFDGI